MQQAKKPFRTRFQLLLRLTLNAGKHPGNQPTRLAQLDDGNDCAILVQGDEGPAQVVQLGHKGTPSVSYLQRRWCHLLRRLPHTISSLEGTGFEPSVARQEKWSMPSSSGQTRVGRTLTLGGGAESSLDGRDIELSVSPKDIRTSPYDLCAKRSDRRQSREGDRWFESG